MSIFSYVESFRDVSTPGLAGNRLARTAQPGTRDPARQQPNNLPTYKTSERPWLMLMGQRLAQAGQRLGQRFERGRGIRLAQVDDGESGALPERGGGRRRRGRVSW